MTKSRIYWICQVAGWGLYGFLQVILSYLANSFSPDILVGVSFQVVYYILTSHSFRELILSRGWLNFRLPKLIPIVLIITLALSLLNHLYLYVVELIISGDPVSDPLLLILINTLGYWGLYLIWTILYFTFHYIERYNKSLQAETAAREVELQNLKAQLNPHFIFNALNGIRGLVDEDPKKSKDAITMLSHILRNSLISGRKKLVSFEEELKTVMEYLELESIRYEERLSTHFDIAAASNRFLVPPLMLQTLVENGIKHGVAKLKEGGTISIVTTIKGKRLHLFIRNSGQLQFDDQSGKGFGLENTKKRLNLIFGDRSSFSIVNENEKTVLSKIILPAYHESNSS
ncbi:MAG: histidine kinase [Bacteroidota bacterium]